MTQKTSRRKFIQFGAAGVGMFVTNFAGLTRPAKAAGTQSRYMINIQSFGGQDSSWTYSPMLVQDTKGLTTEQMKRFWGVYDQKPRFPDALAKQFGNYYLGLSMRNFNSELGRMAVIRGLIPEGSHDIGNRYIQDGHLSGYAASYSTIVADALAKGNDRLRDLHYVQITNSSADFRSQVGFFHGHGLPLNIADSATWDKLSATDLKNPVTVANDATKTKNMQAALDKAIKDLSNSTGDALQVKASQNLFKSDFPGAYDSTNAIMGQNFSASPAYKEAIQRYKDAILNDMKALIFGADTKVYVQEHLKYHPNFATFAESGLEAALKGNFGVALESMVFPYALADFLITQDLSAVVDVPTWGGDFHDFNDRDFLASACNMACVRALINRLANVNVPEGGATFLDRTLIVYSTEFDRQVARSVLTSSNSLRPGTDHGDTSSVLLAGYRVKGNKMVGGRMTGPEGKFGGVGEPFLKPMPVNANGDPDAAGDFISQRSILPTICEIFGVSVPAQQKTEMESISAVIKPT